MDHDNVQNLFTVSEEGELFQTCKPQGEVTYKSLNRCNYKFFSVSQEISDAVFLNGQLREEYDIRWFNQRIGFSCDRLSGCTAIINDGEPYLNVLRRHQNECNFDCILDMFDTVMRDEMLPKCAPTLYRQNAIYDLKNLARKKRKNLKKKKLNLEKRERLSLRAEKRAMKSERTSEEFISGFNGKNETHAVRRKAETEGFFDITEFSEENFKGLKNAYKEFDRIRFRRFQEAKLDTLELNYDSPEIQKMDPMYRIIYCDKYGIPFPESERTRLRSLIYEKFDRPDECDSWRCKDDGSLYEFSFAARMFHWITHVVPQELKSLLLKYKKFILEMLDALEIDKILDKIKSIFPKRRLYRFLLYIVQLVIVACFARMFSGSWNTFSSRFMLFFTAFRIGVDFADPASIENEFRKSYGKETVFTQAGLHPVKDGLLYIKSFIESAYDSPFVDAIRNVVLLMAAHEFFPNRKHEIKKVFGKFKHYKEASIFEIITVVCDALIQVFTVAEGLSNKTPLHEIFLGEDPVAKYIADCKLLLSFKTRVYDGLPVFGCKHYKEYMAEIVELKCVGRELVKSSSCTAVNKKALVAALTEVEVEYGSRRAVEKNSNRRPPMGIVLHGGSKIGKSLLLKYFCALYSAVIGREFTEDQIFNRSKQSDYCDGYNPYAHPYWFYSELANMSLEMTKKLGDTQLGEMNSLLDGLPMLLNMAFEDKGKVYANPDLVIGDTNNPELWAKQMCAYPAAQLRRYLFIEAIVKSQFLAKTHEDLPRLTSSLDSHESLRVGGNLLDRYEFNVYTYEDYYGTALRVDLHSGDIYTMTDFLTPLMQDHVDRNAELINRDLYGFVKEYVLAKKDPANVMGMRKYSDEQLAEAKVNPNYFETLFSNMRDEHFMEEKAISTESLEEKAFRDPLYAYEGELMPPVEITKWDLWRVEMEIRAEDLFNTSYQILSSVFMVIVTTLLLMSLPHQSFLRNAYQNKWLQVVLFFVSLWNFSQSSLLIWILLQTLLYLLSVISLKDVVVEKAKAKYMEKKAIFVGKFFHFFSRKRTMYLGSGVVCILLLKQIISFVQKARKPVKLLVDAMTEGETSNFRNPDPINEELTKDEDLDNISTDRRMRFKCKSTFGYNVGIAPLPLAAYKGEPEQLWGRIATNIRRVKIVHNGASVVQYILGVKANYALINTHAVPKTSFDIYVPPDNHFAEDTVYRVLTIDPSMVQGVSDDVSLVYMEKLLFSDIVKHLAENVDFPFYDCYFKDKMVRAYIEENVSIKDVGSKTTRVAPLTLIYEYDHHAGLCGYPLIAKTNKSGSQILAIHGAGEKGNNSAFAIPVYRDKIVESIKLLEERQVLLPVFSQNDLSFDQYLPHPKSVFVHQRVDYIDYFMRHEGKIMIKDYSKLEEHPWKSEVQKFLEDEFKFQPTILYGVPMMCPTRIDGEWISPLNNALIKMNNDYKTPRYDVLGRVITYLTAHLISSLRTSGVMSLCPLTMEEAINGVEGDPFIGRINASTSAAYPLFKKKRDHLPIVSEEPLVREPTSDLKRMIYEAKVNYMHKLNNGFIFSSKLKDEPREVSKCLKGKTRLFYMSPLVNLILAREYLAPFYSLMVEFADLFYVAIGVDTHRAAGELFHKIAASFDNEAKDDVSCANVMEGDYGGFDVSMPLFVGRAACTVIYNVCKEFGYSEHALTMVQGLLSDSCYPMVMMAQDVFQKPGLQPSGKYATAEDNSLRSLIMLIYAFYSHPSNRELDFFSCVRPLLYGDDLLARVDLSSGCVFDNLYYARFCADEFGIEYTTASKTGDFEKYLKPTSCSFLKRTFRDHPTGRVVAALDMNSIFKTLQWVIPSQEVPLVHQVHGAFMGTIRELFFHCSGPDQYERCFFFLKKLMVERFGGSFNDYPLPTYSQLCYSIFDMGLESHDE